MVAVCGMNCSYCYAHLKKKKPCPGCRQSGEGKPDSCRKCNIKSCSIEKGVIFCSECHEYPCILIKRLDKSYRTRYDESLVRNLEVIHTKGMDYYINFEKERFQCPECGGTLNLHHKQCSECGQVFTVRKLD